MNRNVVVVRTCLLILIVAIGGCASHRAYVNPEADFGFYQRMGVVPFSNLSNDRTAAEKITSSFTTELLMQGGIDLVNSGDFFRSVREVIRTEKTNYPEEFSSEEALALGRAAQVEGVLVGAVRDYAMVRVGADEFPLVSVTIRLYDCQTGKIAWTYEITRRGGPGFPIFSFGETHTLGDLSSKVCRKAARSLSAVLR